MQNILSNIFLSNLNKQPTIIDNRSTNIPSNKKIKPNESKIDILPKDSVKISDKAKNLFDDPNFISNSKKFAEEEAKYSYNTLRQIRIRSSGDQGWDTMPSPQSSKSNSSYPTYNDFSHYSKNDSKHPLKSETI